MAIAFFDSGIGGITILVEACKQLPHERFLFYADTLHIPYGTKSHIEVMKYVQAAVEEIMQWDVTALVIACNTATSIAVTELRKQYHIPIIGMEPAVKPAVEISRLASKRVLVFATQLTLNENKYQDLVAQIDEEHIVDSIPLPELVEYCENMNFNSIAIEDYFREKLAGLDLEQYGTIVLGCTHFLYYRQILSYIFPNHIQIIDGSSGTVQQLAKIMELYQWRESFEADEHRIQFMCSSREPQYLQKMRTALHTYQAYFYMHFGTEELGWKR